VQVHSFIANSAGEALAQIHQELGPEAVVLHVRPAPALGLARIWSKPRIEVLAARPEQTQTHLRQIWAAPLATTGPESNLHVLVGAAGVGKTTCLCKWLAKTVLAQNRPARIWRLDGRVANTAESLSVYCDILDVPVERAWRGSLAPSPSELGWIDLPGVNWRSRADLSELQDQLGAFSEAQIHLVLNAAYEVPLLIEQARAFAALPIADLIFTHLDEESRSGKLWDVVLGTNFSVRFLSAGQNIPGEFEEASADGILARQFSPV
jgi:flagellar biosynthesis protein FlhF